MPVDQKGLEAARKAAEDTRQGTRHWSLSVSVDAAITSAVAAERERLCAFADQFEVPCAGGTARVGDFMRQVLGMLPEQAAIRSRGQAEGEA